MFKKYLSVLTVLLVFVLAFSMPAGASEQDKEDNRLFEMQGDKYIKKNPYGSGGTSETSPSQPLLVLGKDLMVTSSDGKYPLNVNNTSQKPAYYYIAGSNNIELLMQRPDLIEYLENDYVVEYDLKYADDTQGHVSIALNFNYSYYIDAYLNADGTGDIMICVGGEYYSVMDEDSLISCENGEPLIKALYGDEGDVKNKYVNVAVRVKSGENKLPERIEMYVNGLLAASADTQKLASYTEDLAADYDIGRAGVFPSDALGNIIVLKCTVGIKAAVDNVRIYSVPDSAVNPLESARQNYAQIYGNASYVPGGEDSSENEGFTENESGSLPTEGNTGDKNSDVLIYVISVFAVLDVIIIAAAVILVKKRSRTQ